MSKTLYELLTEISDRSTELAESDIPFPTDTYADRAFITQVREAATQFRGVLEEYNTYCDIRAQDDATAHYADANREYAETRL